MSMTWPSNLETTSAKGCARRQKDLLSKILLALLISVRQIDRSKHDILIRHNMSLIARTLTRCNLNICSTVRNQVSKVCILTGLGVQHELVCLEGRGTRDAGAAGVGGVYKDLGGMKAESGEDGLGGCVADGCVDVELEGCCGLDEGDALGGRCVDDEYFLSLS